MIQNIMLSAFRNFKTKTLHISKFSQRSNTTSSLRIVSINDVYSLSNLPRLQTFLCALNPSPDAVILAGDFLSPSPLSALDGGKGMVQTLRAVGVTHCTLGNHEADLKLSTLKKRLKTLSNPRSSTVPITILNSNIRGHRVGVDDWLNNSDFMHSHVILQQGEVKVGLLGLMSDEKGMFRDDTFKGAEIENCLTTVKQFYDKGECDIILPITHQSITRDKELAEFMLEEHMGTSLIIGGHEHVPLDEQISKNEDSIQILKAGMEAEHAYLIDLTFEEKRLKNKNVELIKMSEYEPSTSVQFVVNTHMSLLTSLEEAEVIHADNFLSLGEKLSSVGTRYKQTLVGGLLCMAIKEETETDVAIINGASIKGNIEYETPTLSYAQLKQELPFPTKIVCVKMKLGELQNAIFHSRNVPPGEGIERKSFLQVDYAFDQQDKYYSGDPNDEITVALPRNLLKGFCDIKPLMEVGDRLEKEGAFPSEDDFIPAFDLVVRYFSKERWYDIAHSRLCFKELDRKGFITRKDVEQMLGKTIGRKPPDFLIDDMIAAVDTDANGIIDRGEFSHLLATIERDKGIRF